MKLVTFSKSVWPSFKSILGIVAAVLSIQLSVVSGHAVSLAWDDSHDLNVVGYRLHYGTQSGNYTSTVDVGNVTSATLDLPADGQTYYIAATSYDADDGESGYSNETAITTTSTTSASVSPIDVITNTGFSENGHFHFNVGGVPGRQYVIEASTNLINWVAVQTNTAPFVFVDDGSSAYSKRFYRPVAL